MYRLLAFALAVVSYTALSSGCCCCSNFAKGFNQGIQQAAEQQRQIAEQQQRAFAEQQKRVLEEQQKLIEQQNKAIVDPFKDKGIPVDPFKDKKADPFKDKNVDPFKDKNAPFKDKKNVQGDGVPRFVFMVKTGQWSLNNQPLGNGFTGKGAFRNSPSSSKMSRTGAMWQSDWRISNKRTDPTTKEPILDLRLENGNPPKSRAGESITIHAENSPTAGESGIAAPRNVRDIMQVGDLIVIDTK
jgi:hypothetical protein